MEGLYFLPMMCGFLHFFDLNLTEESIKYFGGGGKKCCHDKDCNKKTVFY